MAKKLNFKETLLKHSKWHKKRASAHTLVAALIVMALIYPINYLLKPAAVAVEKDDSIFTASVVGDIMFGRFVEHVAERDTYDAHFDNVRELFKSSDYVAGNFEHPVVLNDDAVPIEKAYNFKTKPDAVEALENANFTVANLANNNILDYGITGLTDTINTFNESETDVIGAGQNLSEAEAIHYEDYNGVTVASLGFNDILEYSTLATDTSGGVLGADPQTFLPLIQEAKQNADLVFVHVHWGKEYENAVQPRQRDFAHAMADAGADAIFGSHAHVLAPVEKYEDTVIFYSLGNFIFDQGWSRTKESAIVQYHLEEDGSAQFEVMPAYIEETKPAPLSEKNRYRNTTILRKMTKELDETDWTKEGNRAVIPVDHSHITAEEESSLAE
ncbi:PGA biosynthesis protein CapA [Halobacillus andaensis]|uniref:PGA biosynthesis protein CapA n=1 Tax=Halobacillus andaensis TaxID=1176239 RepID=A0A917B4Z5_HALAA|nr:CapA family protein [Halobacillus andaensis]MBP2004373.1 poly-gamma-glutamate synthesis protein (capsule biosynthesis protein) [Halobacillus andaensis]GGF22110.1 PGA biosynthesis protein CapA [Halobacillus andaensis]